MVDCRACKKRFRADQLDEAGRVPRGAREGTGSRARLHGRPQLQPDAARPSSARRRTPPRRPTCAPRPVSRSSRLQAGARERARQKLPLRDRPDRQGLPQRDQPAQLHLPLARVRAGRARVLRATRAEREKWFEYWQGRSACRFHRDLGFGDDRPARAGAHARPTSWPTTPGRPWTSSIRFPFGFQEIEGVHDRGDYDLSRHGGVLRQGAGRSPTPQTKERFTCPW